MSSVRNNNQRRLKTTVKTRCLNRFIDIDQTTPRHSVIRDVKDNDLFAGSDVKALRLELADQGGAGSFLCWLLLNNATRKKQGNDDASCAFP